MAEETSVAATATRISRNEALGYFMAAATAARDAHAHERNRPQSVAPYHCNDSSFFSLIYDYRRRTEADTWLLSCEQNIGFRVFFTEAAMALLMRAPNWYYLWSAALKAAGAAFADQSVQYLPDYENKDDTGKITVDNVRGAIEALRLELPAAVVAKIGQPISDLNAFELAAAISSGVVLWDSEDTVKKQPRQLLWNRLLAPASTPTALPPDMTAHSIVLRSPYRPDERRSMSEWQYGYFDEESFIALPAGNELPTDFELFHDSIGRILRGSYDFRNLPRGSLLWYGGEWRDVHTTRFDSVKLNWVMFLPRD
jgi:hypothetical protein